jgi:hypothetical protein
MTRQIGKAVGILMRFDRECDAMFEDLRAFHAPSECYGDVEHGQRRRFRQFRRHACRVAGVRNLAQLRREVLRSCPTWDRYNHHRLGVSGI